jgi:tripartite-type tricarboxylate transporter receptor subunit TctC
MKPFSAVALACAVVSTAHAQSYPSKPVRMIVSSNPGGVTDTTARALANGIAPVLGQPIVVENRGGANGNIGGEVCAKAAPDGYNVCLLNGVAITFNPFAYAKMPFDVDRDLSPVVHIGFLDIALVVHTSLPVTNIRELVDLAKQKPGALNWGSMGLGSNAHMYQVWLESKTGARFTHVPYKSSPALFVASTSGEVQVTTNTPGTVQQHVKAGKLRIIGVVTTQGRSPLAPDVPTLKEQGYELDFRNWNGVFFQKAAPEEVKRRWNTEVNRLVADTTFTEKFFAPMAVTPQGGTPEWFAGFIKADKATAAELVKLADLKLQE